MPAKKRPPVGLVTIAFLISIFSVAGQAQTRLRLRTPQALLNLLEKEDRDCVLQNGGLSKTVTARPIHLAADGSQQILIKGSGVCLCGAQNCYFWIYRKTGEKYELLLTGTGATKVRAGPRRSAHGYRDVISESHASANETIIRTYRYDGSEYLAHDCVNRAYYNDAGEYTREPTFRPCEVEKKSEPLVTLPSSILASELTTLDNRHLKLSDYPDRVIVLNIFAAWCIPCRSNVWDLIALKQNYHAYPIEVITVVMDSKNHDQDIGDVRKALGAGINFPVVWDQDDFVASLMKVMNKRAIIPQTYVIDRNGVVQKVFLGFAPAKSPLLLRRAIDKISRQPNTSP